MITDDFDEVGRGAKLQPSASSQDWRQPLTYLAGIQIENINENLVFRHTLFFPMIKRPDFSLKSQSIISL